MTDSQPDRVFIAPPSPSRFLVKWLIFNVLAGRDPDRYFRQRARLAQWMGRMGLYETAHLRFLRRLVKPGDHVLDIGANFGAYAIVLADLVGPGGLVHAVDPLPLVYPALRALALRLPQIRLYTHLLSDIPGTPVVLKVPFLPGGIPEPAFGSLHLPEAPALTFPLMTTTLDTVLGGLERLDFLKVDVEGHERSILAGGEQTIEQFKPIIQFESVFAQGEFEAWSDWAGTHGYRLMQLSCGRLEPLQSQDEADGYNFYLVHTDRAVP